MSSKGDLDEGLTPLRATVVEYEHKPSECTIHPVDPPEGGQTTAWITAEEGSYVALATTR
ncbi:MULTISPECIES: hypothetical protein [Halobellus]|jgi:hypothetical protein|uniref:DUF7511 domain-containing protein n=1 Tax=Halobellus TaxID=1073986 RepID=UPI000EF1F1B0|nr:MULTISPECIES: hypothetical protein [Halobellus]MDQ2054475.1 hypothetical protein [Halobellus sp. H-GB7]RLM89218.1 hypothetical protein D3D02_08815 [Halobellus sp. Atlit-38R]